MSWVIAGAIAVLGGLWLIEMEFRPRLYWWYEGRNGKSNLYLGYGPWTRYGRKFIKVL